MTQFPADDVPVDLWLHRAVEARVQRRRQIAMDASTDTFSHADPDRGRTPGGEHWVWECSSCDIPIAIDDVSIMDEMLECPECGSVGVDLRSVEKYTHEYVGYTSRLPHLITHGCEETRPIDAAQIITNDPAATIRFCDRDLDMLKRHRPGSLVGCYMCREPWARVPGEPCVEVKAMAEAYGLDVEALRP